MALEIKYNGKTIATLEKGQTVTLPCEGKKMITDLVVTISAESGGTNLISFTIDGTTYQAEEGMTWEQWLESDYNTAGYVCTTFNGVLTVTTGGGGLSYEGVFIPIQDAIVADRPYVGKSGQQSGSGNN